MSSKKESQLKKTNFVKGVKGINLIPPLSTAEVAVVQTKSTLNLGAAISLFILFLLTVLIVGFNIVTKLELNSKKSALYKVETRLKERENLMASNNEILSKIELYQRVSLTSFSVKDLLTYLKGISKGMGTISDIKLTGGTMFAVSGTTKSLTDVSKLWYLLGNDRFIKVINLRSFSKDSKGARFEFEGELNIEEFKLELEKQKAAQNG